MTLVKVYMTAPCRRPKPQIIEIIMHLKVHSSYTLLGSTAHVRDLVARAKQDGMTALALTDRNNLYGAVTFARECAAAGIQPLIGMTLTVQSPVNVGAKWAQNSAEIVLLARNANGYRNLCRLSSHLQAHPEREARLAAGLSWSLLADHSRDLIAIDGGLSGWIARATHNHAPATAHTIATSFQETFGADAYLGLELRDGEQVIAAELLPLPLVALQPVFCMQRADRQRLPLLAAIDRNCRLAAVPTVALPDGGDATRSLHWLAPSEMAQRFAAYPDALANINHIISLCEACLPSGDPIWPVLALESSADTVIHTQCEQGLLQRFAGDTAMLQIGRKRLTHELALINRYGFAPFFLVVADVVRYAREQAIPVSTRGSVANSLVAYCLAITTVDPLAHDLLFERFLNPARRSLPDIDLDFCSRRRDEVLRYIREKYGEQHVALVATVNTFKHKSAVREVAKAMGYRSAEISRLSKKLPSGWHPDPRRRAKNPIERLLEKTDDPQDRAILKAALPLVGQPTHLSVHPGGVVITPTPLTDILPLQWSPKGFVVTQYDHTDCEQIGLPKLDLLGIRALTVLAESAELIHKHYDPTFSLADIPLDDPVTATTLTRGETVGVFQCESHGAQRTLRQLNARTVRDLAVANAFFKPGPMTGGMADSFIRRYRDEEPVTFLHPTLAKILASTKGVLLFQEQILRIAVEIAGLDWQQANQLRKGMSKFDAPAMHALQTQFVTGCCRVEIGMSEKQAATLWEQVLAFAGYGFNLGHATAYADVSYRSAWLRTHYPAAFLTARLANGGGFYHPAIYIAEARRCGIRVEAPHINHSARGVTLSHSDAGDTIWLGLRQIRDLRRTTIQQIIQHRPFTNLDDLRQRVPMQDKELLHLVRCGATRGLQSTLLQQLAQLERGQSPKESQQMRFAFAAPVNDSERQSAAIPLAQQLAWEIQLLDFPIAIHPLRCITLPDDCLALQAAIQRPKETVVTAGVRLPSWDSSGFLLGDDAIFVRAVFPRSQPQTKPNRWQPVGLEGQWHQDRFGNAAFVVLRWWSLNP